MNVFPHAGRSVRGERKFMMNAREDQPEVWPLRLSKKRLIA